MNCVVLMAALMTTAATTGNYPCCGGFQTTGYCGSGYAPYATYYPYYCGSGYAPYANFYPNFTCCDPDSLFNTYGNGCVRAYSAPYTAPANYGCGCGCPGYTSMYGGICDGCGLHAPYSFYAGYQCQGSGPVHIGAYP
jgi:hypothetical protein